MQPTFGPRGRRDRGARLLASMAAALALVATASGSTALGQDDTPVPILGTDIPTGAESGVIETPLGPARWVHLTGNAATLPAEAPFARDSRFVVLEQASNDSGDQLGRRRWASADGLQWTSRPLSVPPIGDQLAEFVVDGGLTWLTTDRPGTLWRSTDEETWEPIAIDDMIPQGPPALEWEVGIGTIASAGGLTAVELNLDARDPFEGWPDPSRVTEVEPGLFSIAPRGDGSPRLLRFEETPTGLRVTEEADGSEVATLEGFTLDFATGWLRNGPPVEYVVARVDGDRLVPTSASGPMITENWTTIVGAEDGIVAIELADPGGPAVAWRLDERGVWTELGPWDITEGGAGGTFQMGRTNESFHVHRADDDLYALYDGPGTPIRKSWSSSDGLHWQPVFDSWPAGFILALDPGYLELQWLPEPGGWWATPDGTAWSELDLAAIGLTPDRWGSEAEGNPHFALGAVGDTAFITVDDRAGNRDMWMLSFDTP